MKTKKKVIKKKATANKAEPKKLVWAEFGMTHDESKETITVSVTDPFQALVLRELEDLRKKVGILALGVGRILENQINEKKETSENQTDENQPQQDSFEF